MPHRITSRPRPSSACRRSAVGDAVEGSQEPSAPRTCSRARSSPSASLPTSCSSTGAARRCLRSPPIAPSSSSEDIRIRQLSAGYLNTYRLLLADVVVVTMAEDGLGLGAGSRPCWRSRFAGHAGDRNDAAAATGCRRRGAVCCLLLRGSTGRSTDGCASTSKRRTAPASSTCPGTSRIAPLCARSSSAIRRGRLPRRAEGRGDRRRRRGGAGPRGRGRPRRERRRAAGRRAGP